MKVALEEISIGHRLRELRKPVVADLAESMEREGLLQPIVLRPIDGKDGKPNGYKIVAGRHRLEAARKLKWDTIEAKVFNGMDANAAETAEIVENLIRADLTKAETALHTAKLKEIYEEENPETKVGKKGRQNGDDREKRFTKKVSDDTGRSERKIQRDAARGKAGKEWLADVAGTSLDEGKEIDALVELPEKERQAVIKKAKAGEKVSAKAELKKIKRAEREAELATKQKALPKEKFGVIVADPPWNFETFSEKGKSRHASNHYPTQSDDEIKALPVRKVAADDCVLFLWTTNPHLSVALEVMEKWGFEYKSNFVWVKNRAGTGYWNRAMHEILLVGTKGKIPAPADPKNSIIEAPVGKHSAKPEAFLKLIERYFPKLPKIELHCRGPARKGWEAWGNEAEPEEKKAA